MTNQIFKLSKYFSLVLMALFLLECSRNPVTGKKEFMLLSEEQEKALGAESDPGIISSYGLYEDQKLQYFIKD